MPENPINAPTLFFIIRHLNYPNYDYLICHLPKCYIKIILKHQNTFKNHHYSDICNVTEMPYGVALCLLLHDDLFVLNQNISVHYSLSFLELAFFHKRTPLSSASCTLGVVNSKI